MCSFAWYNFYYKYKVADEGERMKRMRVSKDPEVRKQEMIDTAMKVFSEKGYEATSMTDIAKEMQVVPGLCYRYFKSKEELYHTALHQYAMESAAPMIRIMTQEYNSVEEYVVHLRKHLLDTDKREKYHDFFHKEGNELFHKQLEYEMIKLLEPHMIHVIEWVNKSENLKIENCEATALFILHGQMPILNDDSYETEEKIKLISELIHKVLYS